MHSFFFFFLNNDSTTGYIQLLITVYVLNTFARCFAGKKWNLFVFTSGNSVSELPLEAGDDAGQVQWVDLDSSFPLYANHSHFLEIVAKERKAHW